MIFPRNRESLWQSKSQNSSTITKPNPILLDFGKLNRAIYDKLFRTPASDPWLGLAPAGAFVALRDGGVQSAQTPQ